MLLTVEIFLANVSFQRTRCSEVFLNISPLLLIFEGQAASLLTFHPKVSSNIAVQTVLSNIAVSSTTCIKKHRLISLKCIILYLISPKNVLQVRLAAKLSTNRPVYNCQYFNFASEDCGWKSDLIYEQSPHSVLGLMVKRCRHAGDG